MELECEFSEPRDWVGDYPSSPFVEWQFETRNCTSTEVAWIENQTTGAELYIRKSISYGDFIVITFLMIFLIFGIMKFLINFLIPKMMNFKNK